MLFNLVVCSVCNCEDQSKYDSFFSTLLKIDSPTLTRLVYVYFESIDNKFNDIPRIKDCRGRVGVLEALVDAIELNRYPNYKRYSLQNFPWT